jgi:NADPH:quinone reductase-like Zn-dependent oxidoreductase
MRAILRTDFGGPEVLVIREVPEPEPKDGHVVIEVKAFGQAALNMAVNAGANLIATSRSRDRFPLLETLGASRCEIERPDLSQQIAEARQLDTVLDLVGNSTILDSLNMLRRGGRACLAGWLGGLDPIHDFNPLLQMPSGVNLTSFGSFVFGTPGFPLSDVRCKRSPPTSRRAATAPSRHACSASRTSARRTA